MATHPRNSFLTDLQWDLAIRDSAALRFIDFVDRNYPDIINENGRTVSVQALDKLFSRWRELDSYRKPFPADLIPEIFAQVRAVTPPDPANKSAEVFLRKRAQAHRNNS
jgi:hypothetical protein